MKKIFLGLMACAALCACTSDDLVSSVTTQKTFDGDLAYMTVRINDVGTGTRATEGTYSNGTAAEYAVNDAYFYFYDAAGVFVSEAEVWDGGDATGEPGDDMNVEFEGNTVIVLKGLTGVGYPNYVVTVLNKPDNFQPGGTLAEMGALLADASSEGIMQGTNTNFTMSTSSYVDTEATGGDSRLAYFVTPIAETDFFAEPVDMDVVQPVDIYVERLAAKVGTDVSEALLQRATTLGDGTTGYLLDETVAGDYNDEGDEDEGVEDIYVKILGWGLNCTAKHSNIVKNIDATWDADDLGFTWNVPSDHRSYWGMSYNYGLGSPFPTSSNGYTDTEDSEYDGTMLNDYLNYISWNELESDMGETTYCTENTNDAQLFASKNSAGITSVLVRAQVCDADGNGLDLVRYQGELFTHDSFLAYVMAELQTTGATSWNVYTATYDEDNDETVYTQIDESYITLAKSITSADGTTLTRVDGYVVVVADEDAFDESVTYYYSTGTTDDEGNPTFAAYESVDAAIAAVNEPLYTFDSNPANAYINAFTGGDMYYNVPIEHLNNNASTVEGALAEANYGVVRNHWYNLTITAVANVGKGVFDPDEVIIPNIDDEQYYYVGAQINILSWKLVNQDVSL